MPGFGGRLERAGPRPPGCGAAVDLGDEAAQVGVHGRGDVVPLKRRDGAARGVGRQLRIQGDVDRLVGAAGLAGNLWGCVKFKDVGLCFVWRGRCCEVDDARAGLPEQAHTQAPTYRWCHEDSGGRDGGAAAAGRDIDRAVEVGASRQIVHEHALRAADGKVTAWHDGGGRRELDKQLGAARGAEGLCADRRHGVGREQLAAGEAGGLCCRVEHYLDAVGCRAKHGRRHQPRSGRADSDAGGAVLGRHDHAAAGHGEALA